MTRLRQTPHGCDWLIARWAGLAEVVQAHQGWDAEQVALAFDLLGVPAPLRTHLPGVEATDSPAPATLLDLARQQVRALHEQRALVVEADAIEQDLVADDGRDLPTAELARLRRYEGALQRRLQRLLGELSAPQPAPSPPAPGEPPRETKPTPASGPKPTLANETKPTPASEPKQTPASEPKPTPASEPKPTPARNRPDLEAFARRDRQRRRLNHRQRPHQ